MVEVRLLRAEEAAEVVAGDLRRRGRPRRRRGGREGAHCDYWNFEWFGVKIGGECQWVIGPFNRWARGPPPSDFFGEMWPMKI